MPNEFVARNGVIALNNSIVTGSLNVTNGITGSLLGTASYAVTASFALNGGSGGSGASYTLNQTTPSSTWTVNHGLNNQFPSITVYDSNGFVIIPQNISSSNVNQTIITFSYTASGYATAVVQGTSVTTASYATNALSSSFASTASYILNATSASFASTASSADNFLVRNTLTATTIVVQTITSSVDFVTGSTRFGTTTSNTHQFTGSVNISGSLTSNGNTTVTGSFTVISGSAVEFLVTNTGVRIGNAVTDTHTLTGSFSISGSITGSRLNPRAVTTASTATITPDLNAGDVFTITSQSVSLVFANPTGNPVEGQRMIIRIKDNGTARALNFSGSQYRASTDLTFPASSSASKILYLGFVYNSTDTKWDLLAKLDNF